MLKGKSILFDVNNFSLGVHSSLVKLPLYWMTSHTIQIFLDRLVKQSAIAFSAELVEMKLKKMISFKEMGTE